MATAHFGRDDVDGVPSPYVAETDGLYQSLVDAVADPLIVVDDEQQVVLFNRAAERVFGYDAGEVLGHHLNLLLPEQYHNTHPGDVEHFAAGGGDQRRPAWVRSRVEARRADGSAFPAEISLSVLEVGGRRLMAAALRDVSARAQTEQALTDSERRFRATFEESPVSMVLVGLDSEFFTGNRAFCEETGFTEEDLRNTRLVEIISEEDRVRLAEELAPVVAGKANSLQIELRYVRKDGGLRTIDLFLAPVAAAATVPQYLIGQAIDVTDRIEAHTRLEHMVRSKDELIASISHELRTPLTALVGFAQLLHDDDSAVVTEDRAEMIDSIVAASIDLKNIVDDLLVAAKAQSGTLAIDVASIDLRAEATQVVEMWNRPGAEPIEVEGPAVQAVGDPARVRQILRNLVSNALRYGVRPITVELSVAGPSAVVAVKDRGTPIPASDRARIFEPYERAHQAKGVAASMGLGLAISRRLARLMEGDLSYRRADDGNVFDLVLPIAAE